MRAAANSRMRRAFGSGSSRWETCMGSRAWLSATTGGESSTADDPTPAETKLAFASTVYGKDPAAAAEFTASELAATENLKREVAKPSWVPVSKGSDPRAMFDSALSQQTVDGKASSDINRDVASDTPDATRVAFRASTYGKDPQMAAKLSEEEKADLEGLRARVKNTEAILKDAAPVHDSRNMFDSDLVHGSGTTVASEEIKRDVVPETPDATRVAFRASVYGKDPQAAAELSAHEAAEIEALREAAEQRDVASGVAAPIHDLRSMFDSDLEHSLGTAPVSDAIKRDVSADTPDATRVVFRDSAYGKDPQAAAALSKEEAAEVEALSKTAARSDVGARNVAPVHHERSMFDSDLVHGAGVAGAYESIKRDVAADTPEVTRVVFGGSDYGKDPRSMLRTDEEQAAIDELAAKAKRDSVMMAKARRSQAPVHHDRSLFDSDLTQGAGTTREFDSIKRDVEPDTPPLTRLSFFGSTCKSQFLL